MLEAIILAGGLGSRLSEETSNRPKPMVEIAGKPILEHVISIYRRFGYKNFYIAGGYKSEVIEDWIQKLYSSEKIEFNIKMIDTGLHSTTGERIYHCLTSEKFSSQNVFVTYGDGLGNVNIDALLSSHETSGLLATVTAVRPPARFGRLIIESDKVVGFREKDQLDEGWINGGFFVLNRAILDFCPSWIEPFEYSALKFLADNRQLNPFFHKGFWRPMDTLRDKLDLEALTISDGLPPWLKDD